MHQYIESIRVVNRQIQHIDYHNNRMNLTREKCLGITESLDLSALIQVPESLGMGVYKCRILYGAELIRVEFITYIPKIIESLKMVHCDEVSYPYKSEDRKLLNSLFENRGDADDVLIVKNGFLMDTSYANIALFDGVEWFTPDTYLLNGTCRQRMIKEGVLREKQIGIEDISTYLFCRPINAMLEFDKTPVAKIVW